MGEFDHLQDVVGQLPFLKTYSHLLLAFPLPDDELSRRQASERLYAASLQITEAFPWLAAKVVESTNEPGRSCSFALEPCKLWSPPNTILRLRDRTSSCPSYDEILNARGPASMLDGNLLAPRKAFPESYHETDEDPAPVVAFQANFVKGGLLLDCAAQHNFIDMKGIENCYNLLAAALRHECFPEEAITQGNLDRRNLVPLLQPHEPKEDHTHFTRPEPGDSPPPPLDPDSPFSWSYFRFSTTSLAQMKALAASSLDPAVQYVSTNDCLTAFCWQRVICVRLRRRNSPQAVAKFCRAVDARNAMDVPPGYMGDLVTIATSRMRFRDLVDAPLGYVASRLRRDLFLVNNREYVRSFATFIANTPDKNKIGYGGEFNPDTDIGSSSWAHIQLAKVKFGPLGEPSLIRRPDFVPLQSDIYLMPQTACGDIDALVCFNQEDLRGLMEDERWNKYAEYIG
ncbi:transferase family-domain-containing protein [Xylariaceae sp. FL0804]|nr:transferase family-domain-containing protein [Xylariaceae sp. FL0804]